MKSQPQNPEFRINPENLTHGYISMALGIGKKYQNIVLAQMWTFHNQSRAETPVLFVCLVRFFTSQSVFFSHVRTGLPGLNKN